MMFYWLIMLDEFPQEDGARAHMPNTCVCLSICDLFSLVVVVVVVFGWWREGTNGAKSHVLYASRGRGLHGVYSR